MAFMGSEFRNLKDLFLEQLADLYDSEKRIVNALPKMEKAAVSPELKQAFSDHLRQTEVHVTRLEKCFDLLGEKPKWETCEGMKGLIEEGEEMIDAKGDDVVRDAGLIAAAQRVEHYEIAGYGTVRTYAREMGFSQVCDILEETLREEEATDRKLTEIAESKINVMAIH